VPSEPAEDVSVMCQGNDYSQRRKLAVRGGVGVQTTRETKGDVNRVDMCETGRPRLQHGVNRLVPC
jgi:hypothetical protein